MVRLTGKIVLMTRYIVASVIAFSVLSMSGFCGVGSLFAATPNAGAKGTASVKQTRQPTQKLTASELYMKARDFFAVGQYKEAIQYAAASQRRSPNTRIATVLMAQSYYRIGNTPRAVALFRSVTIEDIPREAAVDYVLAMFSARRYREVIKGYTIVPDTHPYKDITRYYAGVSLMQFKLYQKAQAYLRNARKLPATLKSQRRRLLSEIDDILDNERQGLFDQPQQYSYQSQQFYFPPPPPAPEPARGPLPTGTPVPSKTPAAAPPPPQASTSFSIKPALSYAQSSVRQDFHGYRSSQTETQTPGASLALGLKFLGKPRSFGAQPSLDVSVTPTYTDTTTKTTSSSLVADVADPTSVQNIVTKTEGSYYTLSQIYGVTGLYPISDPVDIGAGYTETDERKRGSTKSDLSTSTPSAKIVAEIGAVKIDAGWQSAQIKDKQVSDNSRSKTTTKVSVTRNGENTTTNGTYTILESSKPLVDNGIKSTSTLDMSWSRNLDDFSLGVSGNKTDISREPLTAAGVAQNQMSAKLDGAYNLSFGVSLGVSAGMIQYGNIVVLNGGAVQGGPDEVMASGDGKLVKVTLKVAPVSFVSLGASYDYIERKLSVGDESFTKLMMTKNWSQQTTTTLNLSANYSF